MQLSDVRTFIAVADTRSVSRAAQELHLTQPAVTRSLQRLEQRLGATLVDRRARPFELTDFGSRALERCRSLLLAAGAVSGLQGEDASPQGELRIGVAHALSQAVLTSPLEKVQRRYPRVLLKVYSAWSRDLLGRLKAGSIDACAFLWPEGEALDPSFTFERVGTESIHLIASRASRKTPRTISDLNDHPFVLSPEGCAARQGLRQAMAREHSTLRVTIETYNYDLQMALVARGRGLGAVPGRLLKSSRHRTRLRTLKVKGVDLPFGLWLVRRQVPGAVEPALAAFRDNVSEVLQPRKSRAAGG
jgi:DNA-binding transcriptional LysR family regulator